MDSRSRKRAAGYQCAVREFGSAPAIASVDAPSSVTLGGKLFAELMERTPATTAVFCANDDLALGAVFECQRRRIDVPDDGSIIGFNDLEFSASACPSLSTVATPRFEMAQRAAEIILDIIRGSGRPPERQQIDLGFRLVKRESTSERLNSRSVPARI